jgi:D-glycero-D-manno-heptose 1,7-bisphosphate phosphatase
MNKAVFIDKDGTLIKDIPYNVNTRLIELEAHVVAALQSLQACGYQLIVISNQPGVAFSYYSEAALQRVFRFLKTTLQQQGVQLNGYYYCPHHPQGVRQPYKKSCYCRKPLPGMLLKAAMEHDIDLERSWMIGDILNDVEAGNRAGCRTMLLNNGNETEWVLSSNRQPTYMCKSWREAAAIIVHYAKETTSVEHV